MLRREERGFSLLEMMVVVAISVVAAAMAFMSFAQALRFAHSEAALQFAKQQMQTARNTALQTRSVYVVTFTAPGTIQTTSYLTSQSTSVTLPTGYSFSVLTSSPTPPDGFGSSATAIDLGYGTTLNPTTALYFYPDGSSRDSVGRLNGGVVYIGQPGNTNSARAVSVIGATGRVAGWRLASVAGGQSWKED